MQQQRVQDAMTFMFGLEPIVFWGWLFFLLYMGLMLSFGFVGMGRVHSSDDFATARAGYGPVFLALAMTATAASGATFLGLPALAYSVGISSLGQLLYPFGVYIGVWMSMVAIRRGGEAFGSRTIPEYLGDRYQSESLRLLAAVFSMLLLFYLAGQLLSGAVMFYNLLGLETFPALVITAVMLMVYVSMGGAHSDILSDGVQGALMLVLAVLVLYLFLTGFGVEEGGLDAVFERLEALDPQLVKPLHEAHPLFNSYWDFFAIFVAHLPLGLLPHIGNKLWALKSDSDQTKFITLSFAFGLLLPVIICGGLLARAVLGDALLADGSHPNNAIPALFIAILPAWLAALIGAGVLAAVMSTADGLVVSSAQIFANDIFRRTIAPIKLPTASPQELDRISLKISRVATILILMAATGIAWWTRDMNIALLVWIGVGGFMAAIAGPIFLGIFWRGATRTGALTGFLVGVGTFSVFKAGLIEAAWFHSTPAIYAVWLQSQSINPYACTTLALACGVIAMTLVSLFTERLDDGHLKRVFSD